ncbi:MAG: response regulator [Nitrospira sp.]|nr:response regulator [Nitrospira sp.]MBH0185064.1 response regulator [Nitrospira sp.]
MPRHRRIAARKRIKTASASSRNPPASPKRTSSTGVRPRITRSAVSLKPNTASLLEESQETLLKLAQDEALSGGNLSRSFQAITEACCRLLRVERAGVWLFTDHRDAIALIDLFESRLHRHSAGTTLPSAHYPAYFRSLIDEERAIVVHDAAHDPRTKEFTQHYLTPFKIGAMLDAPIRQKGTVVGVLCAEQVGTTRRWNIQEEQVASSLATMATLAIDAAGRREGEQALRDAKEAAEVANRAKSEFLANMSHEIRTPMNAIIGMADLLWETALTSEQRKYLRIFRRAGGTLLTLINDILDLSKIESGHLELDSVDFDLHEAIDRALEMSAMRANEKSLELVCRIAPDVPASLIGDPTRLIQIFVNLIGNALKFTDKGSVVVQVTNDKDARTPGAIQFSVSDTGIGIPTDQLAAIFARFTQVHRSSTKQYGGTGLGLAITKQLVELMNGRIWAESVVGTGSIFHGSVTLGVQPAHDVSKLPAPINLSGIRTLVVDDHPTNRVILRETLAAQGALITESDNGADAIQEIHRASEHSTPYELLLLDASLPDMTGFHMVEQLKTLSVEKGLVTVMLTSDHWADDIARTYDLGLGGYLVKPIRRADLLQTLSIALTRAKGPRLGASTESTEPAKSAAIHPLRLLLVEDSPDNQVLVSSYLKHTSHSLDIADNGAIGVEKFKNHPYDVVLMDIQMPVLNGYGATKSIREWERTHDLPPVPIIALTAYALKEETDKIFQAGCTAHITKPVKKTTLLEILQTHQKRAA